LIRDCIWCHSYFLYWINFKWKNPIILKACYISRAFRQWMLTKKTTTLQILFDNSEWLYSKNSAVCWNTLFKNSYWLPARTRTHPILDFQYHFTVINILIGYDTNFHVSNPRPRMYLSTTIISLSVILRLLNSKTCKICKQKNHNKKNLMYHKEKFVDERSRVCIHLPTPKTIWKLIVCCPPLVQIF
jgi:hypothetical protein